jgi:hypothetical protein
MHFGVFVLKKVLSIFYFKKLFLIIGVENLFCKFFENCFWKLKKQKYLDVMVKNIVDIWVQYDTRALYALPYFDITSIL